MTTKLFLFAGEKSGDHHGGHLMKALCKMIPENSLSGVGGPEMRAEGLNCIRPMEDFQVMGIYDVLLSLPKLIRYFLETRNAILNTQPDGVILIDYPGFNLRLAKALRKRGYRGKIIQYVSPSFWAWGKERVQQMEETLDLLLTIYPFEAEQLAHSKLDVRYVGNPAKEAVAKHVYQKSWKKDLGISPGPLLALFPGSRKGEISRILPDQLLAALRVQKEQPEMQIAISCSQKAFTPLIQKIVAKHTQELNPSLFYVPQNLSYELMQGCTVAIAKPGTVIMELALHATPTVVAYRLNWINYLYVRFLLRLNLPYYSIINILGDKEIYPECIADGVSPDGIYKKLQSLIQDPTPCIQGCKRVIEELQDRNTSEQASGAITYCLKRNRTN